MKRFIYKVLKPFTLIVSDGLCKISKKKDVKDKGTSFEVRNQYVDYDCPDKKGLGLTKVTERLKAEGYIDLVSKREL